MNEVTATIAHENYKQIREYRKIINSSFWELVRALKECRENRYWQALGNESWESFLGQPEIDLRPQTVDNYLTVYNKLEAYNLLLPSSSDIDIGKLIILTPYLTKENAEELLEKAKTLSRSDLRIEVTGKEPEIKTKCICPTCGNKHDTNKIQQP